IKLVGGGSVTANDEYIRNSILNPASQVVDGYQPIMPTFKGQVTEEGLNALVAYIKSLSPNAATAGANAPSASNANSAPAANKTAMSNSNK
ncbi:MAG: cytochrome c oxidase subunit II, partial [Pyrinomonadaceae bacterium]